MDLRALRYFVEVVRLRNFTRASETLHITQPTLSKMIRQLEEELQSELLVRGSRSVWPTDVGQLLYERGNQILQLVRTVKDEIAEVKGLTRGELTLGLTPMISSALFPAVLRVFRSRYPQISLTVIECGSKRMAQALSAGELELGLMAEPVDMSLFETRRVYSGGIGVAVRADSPWARREHLALHELAGEKFLFPTDDFLLPDLIRAHCRELGFTPTEVGHSAQWDLLQVMVEAGMGVALIALEACRLFDPARIHVMPLIEPEIPLHMVLAWRRGAPLSFAAKAWTEISAEVLAEEKMGCLAS